MMSHTPRTRPGKPGSPDRRRHERGIALVLAMFAMVSLMLVATTSMLVTSAGIRTTRNYRGASQVHFVAESAISRALQVINGPGVVHLENEVVAPWTALWGNGVKSFAPLDGFTYTVTPVALASDPKNLGRLIATGYGPEGVRNTVVANVRRSNIPSSAPGAVYLASDNQTNAVFNGNSFQIDGNDHNYTGGYGSAAPVPGISTRNDTNTQHTINTLSDQQKDNVTGAGYSAGPPMVTSVQTSPAAPSLTQLDKIIADLLNLPGVQKPAGKNFNGGTIFGTVAVPQITYLQSADGIVIKGNGNVEGAGILIVDGNLTIQGNLDFKGLVIVRGSTEVKKDPITQTSGSMTLYGSLWTTDIGLTVGGSAVVNYSSQALNLANSVGGGGALPSPVQVTSLADCSQLPPYTSGCP